MYRNERAEIRKILVAVDGSAHSVKPASYAAELASRCDASVTLIHVYTPPGSIKVLPAQEHPGDYEVRLAPTRKIMERANVEYNTLVKVGNPAMQVLGESENGYDLVVIGNRGMSSRIGLIMGSVTTKLPRNTKVPVIIVP